jgi:Zn-dependent protease with chaperone function
MPQRTWPGSTLPSDAPAPTLAETALIRARFFDGRSSQPVPCVLSLQAAAKGAITLRIHALSVAGSSPAVLRTFTGAQIDWPDAGETRVAIIRFADGSHVQTHDAAALNAALHAAGYRPPGLHSLAAKMSRSWRALLAGVLVCGALTAAAWLVGVPAAANVITRFMPTQWDAELGTRTLETLDGAWLKPSKLPPEKQAQIRGDFAALVKQAWPDGSAPAYQLHFRSMQRLSLDPAKTTDDKKETKEPANQKSTRGANAFALPGGALVMTDELVALAEPAALLGVLAHELGHVQRRHATRIAVESALLGAAVAVISGDPTSVLATVPVMLATLSFSRGHELEADCFALQTLARAGVKPEPLARLLETITEGRSGGADVLSSHPSTPERVKLLRDAGATKSTCKF